LSLLQTVPAAKVADFLIQLHDLTPNEVVWNHDFALLSAKWIVPGYVSGYNRIISACLSMTDVCDANTIDREGVLLKDLPLKFRLKPSSLTGAKMKSPQSFIGVRTIEFREKEGDLPARWHFRGSQNPQYIKTRELSPSSKVLIPKEIPISLTVNQFWEMMEVVYSHPEVYHHPHFESKADLMFFLTQYPDFTRPPEGMQNVFDSEELKIMKKYKLSKR
jgi:hypothetical protein